MSLTSLFPPVPSDAKSSAVDELLALDAQLRATVLDVLHQPEFAVLMHTQSIPADVVLIAIERRYRRLALWGASMIRDEIRRVRADRLHAEAS